jgi:hypothetical protein
MKVRPTLVAVLSVVSLPVLATTGFTPASTEAGGTLHAMPAPKTRADVLSDLAVWKRNPVTANGWREVGGEAGWVYVGGPSQRTRGTLDRGAMGRSLDETRADVLSELAAWKRNPVTADGWREVGGEAGWVYVGGPSQRTRGTLDRGAMGRSLEQIDRRMAEDLQGGPN